MDRSRSGFSQDFHRAILGGHLLIRESRDLETVQPLLFAEDELPWRPAYDPGDVRDRLEAMLAKMRAAASWPWKPSTVCFYRETFWPSLLSKLPDAEEAAHLREMEAEITRLDAPA